MRKYKQRVQHRVSAQLAHQSELPLHFHGYWSMVDSILIAHSALGVVTVPPVLGMATGRLREAQQRQDQASG